MRFISFEVESQLEWGILEVDKVYQCSSSLPYPTLLAFIQGGEEALTQLQQQDICSFPCYSIENVRIVVPIVPTKNMLCVGKNYREHALEMANQDPAAIPADPVFFTKPPTSLISHLGTIEAHAQLTSQLDYEGELAVIIGRKGKNISRTEADEYIFGYSILNDVTARDLQKKHQQFFKGKSLDSSAPFGPVIVHHSLIHDPQALQIRTYVNEELRQDCSTGEMIFAIPELIEVLSQGMTLEPGDIIATGTPSGVGKGFHPPAYLKAGDTVRIEIELIGVLENHVL